MVDDRPRKGTPTPPISSAIQTPNTASRTDLGRVPPHDEGAERVVLGTMMLYTTRLTGDPLEDPDVVGDVTEICSGGDFYQPRHELIFNAILRLARAGLPAEPISLFDELDRAGSADHAGGAVYLTELFAEAATADYATHYAGIVREHALRRQIIAAGMKVTQLGYDSHDDAAITADEAQQVLYQATANTSRDQIPLASSLLEDTYTWLEDPTRDPGLTTGFTDVDKMLGGIQPGNVIIIAARPGVGKSTFAMDIVRHNTVTHQIPTLFVSLEMSRHELMLRLLAAQGTIPLQVLKDRTMTPHHWDAFNHASTAITPAPLYFDDRPASTPVDLRTRARRLQRKAGLGLIVIDYLQLLSSGRRVESRQVEVSEFSRQIKLLAKELNIPVIALSQLNRSAEQRADRKPALADLRESGSLEQDADMVLLLHRDDLHDPTSPRKGEADVIIAKNRNGSTGTAALAFQGGYSRFANLAR